MKFALSLPNVGPPQRLVDLACRAEASGWDGVFLWDHIHLFRRSSRRKSSHSITCPQVA